MGTRLVYRRPGPSAAVAAANPSGRNPPRRSCTDGCGAGEQRPHDDLDARDVLGGQREQPASGPAEARGGGVRAEARSAAADSATSFGSPVEPEVAMTTAVPAERVGRVCRAPTGSGRTGGPPSSAAARASTSTRTRSGDAVDPHGSQHDLPRGAVERHRAELTVRARGRRLRRAVQGPPQLRRRRRPPPPRSNPAAAPVATAPSAAAGSFGDGPYTIPDQHPGSYQTDGNAIIANGTLSGPTTVTIKKTDAAFQTRGGCTWTRR